MGLLIGMDEAGYGPNLGPLVITVTVWEVPGPPHEFDCWNALNSMIARPDESNRDGERLLVGDSKQVYTPAKGLKPLEGSVLTLLSALHATPASFQSLCGAIATSECQLSDEPWYAEDLAIPIASAQQSDWATRWQETCTAVGIVFRGARSDVVLTERFNRTVELHDSKGLALSRISLALLRTLWDPEEQDATLIVADKHGGRNRYDELLAEALDDRFIFRLEESKASSRYRIGKTELRFQTKAETHFPVAVASMISKYLRELAMECFNRFWRIHLPELKPTKGYPQDARRFREDIAEMQKTLGISDGTLWRNR